MLPRESPETMLQHCQTCGSVHVRGQCLRDLVLGQGICQVCRLSHTGVVTVCPRTASMVQIRLMLDDLNGSTESKQHIKHVEAGLRRELGLLLRGRRDAAK